MKIAIRCTELQQQEWLTKPHNDLVEYHFFTEDADAFFEVEADAFFDLIFDDSNSLIALINKPIFVNAVITTNSQLPENFIRINAWNGFLKREIIELAANENQYSIVEAIMNILGWRYQIVADEPGMIAPRIIAMIVNEAYFGLEDNISTKEEIDTAMKLGTNYPFGPFEWSEKIGLKKIYQLLHVLSSQDYRYTPSTLLKETALTE
jgi:3-hydroxybutyryl-CoA dehydrogenase